MKIFGQIIKARRKESLLMVGISIFIMLILILSIKGSIGNPNIDELLNPKWTSDGALELSPDRGRFALLYSIVEDNSLFFSESVAKFAMPDLGYTKGHYVSLFAPGLSIFLIPGYLLGKFINLSVLGALFTIGIFATCNFILIYLISRKLGANIYASILGGFSFIFASNAFPYSVSFYQHHLTSLLMLIMLYSVVRFPVMIQILIIWFLFGLGITIDYPNAFLYMPFVIFTLFKMIDFKVNDSKLKIHIDFKSIFCSFVIIIPISLFLLFNQISYGNPFKLSGTVTQVKSIEIIDLSKPIDTSLDVFSEPNSKVEKTADDRNAVTFFKTRAMLNGINTLIFSRDRGIIYYAGVLLIGIIGLFTLLKNNKVIGSLIFSIILINFLLYSMWGDPWGGWAFGPRYLIPAMSLLGILTGYTLSIYKKYFIIPAIFIILFSYFSYVNTAAALTSNALPPQPEVLKLEEISGVEQKYTEERNYSMLSSNNSKSFIFNTYFKNSINAWGYFYIVYLTILSISVLITVLYLNAIIRRRV